MSSVGNILLHKGFPVNAMLADRIKEYVIEKSKGHLFRVDIIEKRAQQFNLLPLNCNRKNFNKLE